MLALSMNIYSFITSGTETPWIVVEVVYKENVRSMD